MPPATEKRRRFRFGEFVVSPSRRVLLRAGREIPLIPRYFDLLVLLLERRNEAVSRREILEVVWSDVVVSDGALSQAVRTLRRALDDDSREPIYLRTMPRHGYRFVFEAVVDEDDSVTAPDEGAGRTTPASATALGSEDEAFEAALTRLLSRDAGEAADDDRRAAAELLHALGTAAALRRIDRRPGHEIARALLRDARWDLPHAGPVPLLGQPGLVATVRALIAMRARRAVRLAGRRWASATAGGAAAGFLGGLLGGGLLWLGPGSTASDGILVALPLYGATIGALGGSGVAAGLATAEVAVRSARAAALVVLGAAGGGLVGALAHAAGALALESLFGQDLSPLAGGFEGLVLGGAVGLGYALATPRAEGGMATPRGRARALAAGAAGLTCAVAAGMLGAGGSYLGAMSLEFLSRSFPGSQVGLAPLAHLLGESRPGVWTAEVISAGEGLLFGSGLVLGLTRRPRG